MGMGSSLLLTHLHEKSSQKTTIFSFTESQTGVNGSELTTKNKVGGESSADLTPMNSMMPPGLDQAAADRQHGCLGSVVDG